jgi:hypothetical protein
LGNETELVLLELGFRLRGVDVRDGLLAREENRSLISGRQKSRSEAVESARGNEPAVEDDEAGEVAVHRAEAIAEPRAHARTPLEAAAGVEEVIRRSVLGELRGH